MKDERMTDAERMVSLKVESRRSKVGRRVGFHDRGRAARASRGGFTLVEVMVSMTVLLLLVMGMTRMFSQASSITSQGMTSIARNSVAETALETILQDVDGMIVNERLGCYMEAEAFDAGAHGFGFDELWFVGTSGDQDDDMPYEYFHYYVKREVVTNSLGAPYVRFDLHKARMTMAVGDRHGVYALTKGSADWWNRGDGYGWEDDKVLAENVVRFDFYCQGWNGFEWLNKINGTLCFDSTRKEWDMGDGNVSDVPPAAFDIYLQITSPDAAMEGGMALVNGMGSDLEVKGRELMIRESASYFGRAVPVTGTAQLHHPETHYIKN